MPQNRFVWKDGDLELLDPADAGLINEKWDFIHTQILYSCIAASFQRAHVYAEKATDQDRTHLHTELSAELGRIGEKYHGLVNEPDHVGHIVELAARMTKTCSPALAGGRFRIGIAQKSLNLYLKYLWCLRRIPMPPHCPFDSRIIALLPKSNYVAWTTLDSVAEYEKLVAAARQVAGGKPLAEWELLEYQ